MKNNTFKQIFIGLMLILGVALSQPFLAFGASSDVPSTVAFFEDSLASSITESATSFNLVRGTDITGTALASSTYGFVIDEGTSVQEMVLADCTGRVCTNVTRGVSPVTGTTTVSTLQKDHRRGASVKMTDGPVILILQRLVNGIQGFPAVLKYLPSVATSSIALNDTNLVNVALLNDTAFNGAAVISATESARGVSELATQTEQASSTTSGSSGPLVLQAKYATSTAPASGLYTVVSKNDGNLDQGWLDLTATWPFTGTVSVGGRNVVGQRDTMTAGETFTGATTPQPYYASTTDSRIYLTDANVATKYKFAGFVVSSGAAAASVTIQSTGIVDGFSALSTGEYYYASNTAGAIATTPGDMNILVGQAISATEIQILKGTRHANGSGTSGTANGTLSVFTGFRPTKIQIIAATAGSSAGSQATHNWAGNAASSSVSFHYNEGTGGSATAVATVTENASDTMTYSVQSVTDTGFTIAWVESGTVGTSQPFTWSADGDI